MVCSVYKLVPSLALTLSRLWGRIRFLYLPCVIQDQLLKGYLRLEYPFYPVPHVFELHHAPALHHIRQQGETLLGFR